MGSTFEDIFGEKLTQSSNSTFDVLLKVAWFTPRMIENIPTMCRMGDNHTVLENKKENMVSVDYGITKNIKVDGIANYLCEEDKYFSAIEGGTILFLFEYLCACFSGPFFISDLDDEDETPSIILSGVDNAIGFHLLDGTFDLRASIQYSESNQEFQNILMGIEGKLKSEVYNNSFNLELGHLVSEIEEIMSSMIPGSPLKKRIFKYMFTMIIFFLWFHEMVHIYEGHLAYLSRIQDTRNSRLHELEPHEDASGRQQIIWLEYEADMLALDMTTNLIASGLDRVLLFGADEDQCVFEISKPERIGIFYCLLYGLMACLSNKEAKLTSQYSGRDILDRKPHPRFSLRSKALQSYISYRGETDPRFASVREVFSDRVSRLTNDRPFIFVQSGINLDANFFNANYNKYMEMVENFGKRKKDTADHRSTLFDFYFKLANLSIDPS
jgi:hypothetical protein